MGQTRFPDVSRQSARLSCVVGSKRAIGVDDLECSYRIADAGSSPNSSVVISTISTRSSAKDADELLPSTRQSEPKQFVEVLSILAF